MKVTQINRILRHLDIYGEISSAVAMSEYGIMRLASRIHDLKMRGYHITSETRTSKNRFGEAVSFKVYRLADGGRNG